MSTTEDLSDVVEMLLARMETNPEDFYLNDNEGPTYPRFRSFAWNLRADYLRTTGQLEDGGLNLAFLSEEEIIRLGEALVRVHRKEFRHQTMMTLLRDPEPVCDIPVMASAWPTPAISKPKRIRTRKPKAKATV